mmetsp:Transcript_52912/g.72255  ORF Transcript_52912/g.72255 Transcript_52912/m.72255 type:complete len:80 (+) Transcript_52912:847-1086(+)
MSIIIYLIRSQQPVTSFLRIQLSSFDLFAMIVDAKRAPEVNRHDAMRLLMMCSVIVSQGFMKFYGVFDLTEAATGALSN